MEIESVASYFRLEHQNSKHADYVVVNWCIGNTCNYRCSYCPEGLHDGSKPWLDLTTAKTFCEWVIRHYAKKTVYFEFTGGEVTLWKHLPELCRFLKQKGSRVGIISNGARSVDYWTDLLPCIDHVCLSFHPESANEEHFLKIVALAADAARTHVNLMMSPAHFNRCYVMATKVKEIPNVSIALQPLIKDFGEELFEYSPLQSEIMAKQFELIVKHIKHTKTYETYRGAMTMVYPDGKRVGKAPQRFISAEQNSWTGWRCSAGVEQIVIDMDGSIFRGWCLVGGKIGKVTDKRPALPSKPVLCAKNKCHCNFDIMTTKERLR